MTLYLFFIFLIFWMQKNNRANKYPYKDKMLSQDKEADKKDGHEIS
ncbi:MAG: hypothetical protein HRT44_00505 [Bdellovibrionales bacterium]|nr:hypothetical protein [Bdellovibrionales bacterium]